MNSSYTPELLNKDLANLKTSTLSNSTIGPYCHSVQQLCAGLKSNSAFFFMLFVKNKKQNSNPSLNPRFSLDNYENCVSCFAYLTCFTWNFNFLTLMLEKFNFIVKVLKKTD